MGDMLEIVMMREIDRHMDPEELEKYAMGDAPVDEAERIEEHLLVCASCRRNLSETENYVRSMAHAASAIRRSPPRFRWVTVFGAVACVAVLAVFLRWSGTRQAPLAVSLAAVRGAVSASATAGRALELHPDLTGLAASSSYRLEMVDHDGARLWQGELARPRQSAVVPSQPSGTYFVRVYSPRGELLREYGLEVR
jgi:anti-sigma factor RsiW